MRKNVLVSSLLCLALGMGVTASAGENWIGTWKVNTSKSTAPTSGLRVETLKFEATPDGIKLSSEGTDAGKPTHASYTSKFDGKEVPWTGNPLADTAAPKKVDDNSYVNSWKLKGKGTVTAKVVVSADGKTLTVTQEGTDAQGGKVHSVAVYDRQ